MSISIQYAYFFGSMVLLLPWLGLYLLGKRVRREMLIMSLIIGVLSVLTAYFWWTLDWWHPQTITGTRVGIEDFLMGFASGGIMAVLYEIVLKINYKKVRKNRHQLSGPALLSVLAVISWSLWLGGLPSFWVSVFALATTASLLYWYRKDLLFNGLVSGVLMVLVSSFFYVPIIVFSPEWVQTTYDFKYLSGILPLGIPIEEMIFWFFAGVFFGPFYEYWKQQKAAN